MKSSISILITGSEVLDGRVADTNSHFIIQRCAAAGLSVAHTLSCTDDIERITQCLNFLTQHSNIVVVSGGLGPTSDDVTTEAIANFVDQKLELNEAALKHLEELFQTRKRPFDEANKKQAYFP